MVFSGVQNRFQALLETDFIDYLIPKMANSSQYLINSYVKKLSMVFIFLTG